MKKKIATLIFLSMSLTIDAKIKHILLDINLLLATSSSAASEHVGKWNAIKYSTTTGHFPNKTDFFKALSKCPAESSLQTYNEDLLMPSILSDWLMGLQSNTIIKQKVSKYLDSTNYSEIEKTVFKNITNMMLSPLIFIETQYLVKEIVKIVKAIKKTGQYNLYIIGNWDKESEGHLIKMLQQSSVHCTCFFSHKVQQLKPHLDFFTTFLNKYNLDPKECLLVDVEKHHVQGATKAGITAVHIKGQSSSQMKTELSRYGIKS